MVLLVPNKTNSPIAAPSQQVSIAIEPVLLDVQQSAVFLAASTRRIRYLINTNKLKHARLGKKLVISVASLREYANRLVAA
jgi:hypothetical protein